MRNAPPWPAFVTKAVRGLEAEGKLYEVEEPMGGPRFFVKEEGESSVSVVESKDPLRELERLRRAVLEAAQTLENVARTLREAVQATQSAPLGADRGKNDSDE